MPYKTKVRKMDLTNPESFRGLNDVNSMRSMGIAFYGLLSDIPVERKCEAAFLLYDKVVVPFVTETDSNSLPGEQKAFRYIMDGFQRAAIKAGNTQTPEYVSRRLAEMK